MAEFTPEEITEVLREFFDAAGKRTYVGLRYVPIFGRKGEDTIEWDGGLAPYEPLTIVLYEGNSYTSRTYVPVGVEITNTDYWAKTGDYNAQVELYRQEVVALGEGVSAIESILPMSAFSGTTVAECIENDNIASSRLRLNVDAQNGDDSNPNLFKTISGALAYACKRNCSFLYIYVAASGTYSFPSFVRNLNISIGVVANNVIIELKGIYTCYMSLGTSTSTDFQVDLSGSTLLDSNIVFDNHSAVIINSTNTNIYKTRILFYSSALVFDPGASLHCYVSSVTFAHSHILFLGDGYVFYVMDGTDLIFRGSNAFTFPADGTAPPFRIQEGNLYYSGYFSVTDEYSTNDVKLFYLDKASAIIEASSDSEISAVFTGGYIAGGNSIVKKTSTITELT